MAPTPPPDAAPGLACVARAWAGHGAELRGFLRHELGDEGRAADALQEVFLRALRQGQGFCRLDNPRAWLFTVARHLLVDLHRRHGLEFTSALPDELPASEPDTPAVDALDSCLLRVLEELPPADAQVLRECDLQGLHQADFAARHGLSLPATKSRLLRARARLRRRMVQVCRVQLGDDGRVLGHLGREAQPCAAGDDDAKC